MHIYIYIYICMYLSLNMIAWTTHSTTPSQLLLSGGGTAWTL